MCRLRKVGSGRSFGSQDWFVPFQGPESLLQIAAGLIDTSTPSISVKSAWEPLLVYPVGVLCVNNLLICGCSKKKKGNMPRPWSSCCETFGKWQFDRNIRNP